MKYARMDHAAWVEGSILKTTKGKAAINRPPASLSPFQARVMDILGIVGGGIYNAPIAWPTVEWGGDYGGLFVSWSGSMSTHDSAALSCLVFLCHEARIRCEIAAGRPGYFRLGFWPGAADGSICSNLSEAVAAFRGSLPTDHPILYTEPANDALKAAPAESITGTVADIPDEELLRRAVCGARSRNHNKDVKHPRLVAVMDIYHLGSTYAGQLCTRFGLDPYEQVAR